MSWQQMRNHSHKHHKYITGLNLRWEPCTYIASEEGGGRVNRECLGQGAAVPRYHDTHRPQWLQRWKMFRLASWSIKLSNWPPLYLIISDVGQLQSTRWRMKRLQKQHGGLRQCSKLIARDETSSSIQWTTKETQLQRHGNGDVIKEYSHVV